MHVFTLVQLVCFGLVCGVKWWKVVSFAFPLAIALTCLLRHFLLPRIFSPLELAAVSPLSSSFPSTRLEPCPVPAGLPRVKTGTTPFPT